MRDLLKNEIVNVGILNIVIQETGTYNQQYLRPYETNVQANTLDNFVDRLKEAKSLKVTPGVIADLSSSILTPSARPSASATIINGWDTPREKFLIIAEVTYSVGNKEIIYLQGYTDYTGVSTTINNITYGGRGAIDPELVFNVNSVSKVNVLQTISNGVTLESKRATSSDQILNPVGASGGDNRLTVHGLRPVDVISDINSQWIGSTLEYAGASLAALDTRTILGAGGVDCSRRTNNIPSNYLSDFVSTYMISSLNAEQGLDPGEIANECRAELAENSMQSNPFIRQISLSSGVSLNNGWFKWKDILAAYPYAYDRVTYVENTNLEYSSYHRAGMTEDISSMTRESIAAALIAQTVPAIMTGCLIHKLAFSTTNRDIGGLVTTVISNFRVLNPESQIQSLDLFKSRFEREIYRTISFNNSDIIDLDVKSDLYGDTWVTISINGGSPTTFVYPTFCDSLVNPNMSLDNEGLHKISGELEILGRTCSDALFENRVKVGDEQLFGYF